MRFQFKLLLLFVSIFLEKDINVKRVYTRPLDLAMLLHNSLGTMKQFCFVCFFGCMTSVTNLCIFCGVFVSFACPLLCYLTVAPPTPVAPPTLRETIGRRAFESPSPPPSARQGRGAEPADQGQ